MSEVSFDVDALLNDAVESAGGLTDFGPDAFREPLEVLAQTYDRNPWTEKGRRGNRRRLVGLLATRLKMQAAFRANPEIKERPVSKPMVLTGLPRSGTSALFNLLGADPAARPLLLWETQFPEPAENLAPGDPDPRREMIEAYYAEARKKNPEFTKIHFASADTPEECVLLHAYSIEGVHIGIEIMLEPYGSWLRERDLKPMYDYYADSLRLLDWQRPGERWLLKAPAHMWGIDALVATFPDVSIVWSHRDPIACTASICSMTASLFGKKMDIDPKELGPVVMDWYATSLERGLEARAALDPGRFIDVHHDDFVRDGLGEAKRIYEHFDVPMPAAASAALEKHQADHPQNKHGKHQYDLAQFGMSVEQVDERFHDYIERFEIRERAEA